MPVSAQKTRKKLLTNMLSSFMINTVNDNSIGRMTNTGEMPYRYAEGELRKLSGKRTVFRRRSEKQHLLHRRGNFLRRLAVQRESFRLMDRGKPIFFCGFAFCLFLFPFLVRPGPAAAFHSPHSAALYLPIPSLSFFLKKP